MEKNQLLYEGKAKKIFATENPNEIMVYYKDDATAFNAQKRGTVVNKGVLNNKITEIIFNFLKANNIPTHFIKRVSDREQLCKLVQIIPLEIIVRNYFAGSTAKKLNVEEGVKPDNTIYELCYKNDSLGDPLINEHHAVALKLATYSEITNIIQITERINELLKKFWDEKDIILIDFKIEFGRDENGQIVLADEISPDTCRFWEKGTLKKLDKDRFRRDLGNVEDAYIDIYNRIK